MSIQLRDGLANQPLDHILEDLLVRFLVNVPDEDLSSIERVFFQVEEAQWFYTDFIRQVNPSLPSMRMKSFAPKLLKKCPLIWKWGEPADAISRFGKYKSTIPVRGVALLNKDLTKVVLVKGTESNSWSFPRGKISKDELDLACAIREVHEETGFDADGYINEDDVLERTIRGKNYKIYLAKNVPEDYKFEPVARHEISEISWHDIKGISKNLQLNHNQYFIVETVMKPMLQWINKQKGVLNEQELMISAEIKLKELLGITRPPAINDAGRELLNILQGANNNVNQAASNNNNNQTFNIKNSNNTNNTNNGSVAPNMAPPYQQLIQSSIPNYLQTHQLPFFANPQGYPQPNAPFFVPSFPPNGFAPFPQAPSTPQPAPHSALMEQMPLEQNVNLVPVPNPQSFQKPTSIRRSSEANSKELLSILTLGGNKKTTTSYESEDSTKNRSKAQLLLNLVNKKVEKVEEKEEKPKKIQILRRPDSESKSKSPTPFIPEPEREIPTQKKVTILKRKPESDESPANEILQLLGKPKSSGQSTSASSELLGVLRSKPQPQSPKQQTPETQLQSQYSQSIESSQPSQSASHELLGLLRKPKAQESVPEPEPVEPVQLIQSIQHVSKPPQPVVEQHDEDFDDFEDFEDFEDYNHHNHNLHKNIANELFDVESEDEFANEHEAPLIFEPAHNTQSDNSLSSKPDSKGFLNLLSQGNVNTNTNNSSNAFEIPDARSYQSADKETKSNDHQSNQSASQNLLSLLGRGPSKPSSGPISLQDIESHQTLLVHQLPEVQPPQQPQQPQHFQQHPFQQQFHQPEQQYQQQYLQQPPPPPQQQEQFFSNASPNPLLDMLHNPSNSSFNSNPPNQPNQVNSQNSGTSSARDLLNILKGGKF